MIRNPQTRSLRRAVAGFALAFSLAEVSAQTYTVLHNLSTNDGRNAHSQLIISGPYLYGTADGGGTSNRGTLFRLSTDGSSFTVLKTFGADAAYPGIGLALAGNTLYGITASGGALNDGTVFQIQTDGSGFFVLTNFSGSNGRFPQGHLVLSGTTLYGTTLYGGAADLGTVFKVNTNGSGLTTVKEFTGGSDGLNPGTGLVLSGTTLYGTTLGNGLGNVFKVNIDGSGFVVLHTFLDSSDGSYPYGGFVLSGDTLYGTTANPGFAGTVFSINTNASNYGVIKRLTSADYPEGDLAICGSSLYGTSVGGGTSHQGSIFSLNTDGSSYTVLKSLTGPDGSTASGGLTLSSNVLFGVTRTGGTYSNGVLFAISFPQPLILTPGMSPSGSFQLTFNAIAGTNYTILSATDLSGPWSVATNIISSTNGVIGFAEPNPPTVQPRFYRVAY